MRSVRDKSKFYKLEFEPIIIIINDNMERLGLWLRFDRIFLSLLLLIILISSVMMDVLSYQFLVHISSRRQQNMQN